MSTKLYKTNLLFKKKNHKERRNNPVVVELAMVMTFNLVGTHETKAGGKAWIHLTATYGGMSE
eukprot:3438740-Prorocentrum_lima.AAC.1